MSYRLASDNRFPVGPPTRMTRHAFGSILRSLGSRPPESGGKLFSPVGYSGVDVYEDDPATAAGGLPCYRPDIEWATSRLMFWANLEDAHQWVGDIHSHPTHWCGFLGPGDLSYIGRVFNANDVVLRRGNFYAPVLTFDPDGVPVLWSWSVRRDLTVFHSPLQLVEGREFLISTRAITCD